MEEMNVHSTVFLPLGAGEPYLVVASALPSGNRVDRTLPCKSAVTATLEHAARMCCELAREVRHVTEQMGHAISGIHCSDCPTRTNPECGSLAQHPQAAEDWR
jgi:hypothetical protein